MHKEEELRGCSPLIRTIVSQTGEVEKVAAEEDLNNLPDGTKQRGNGCGERGWLVVESAQYGAVGGVSRGLIFVVEGVLVGVKRRDARERRGRAGGFRQIFVAIEANGYSDLGFGASWAR
jgi:hypothetical protein